MRGNADLVVSFGQTYGPSEKAFNSKIPECQVPVSYVAPCGHSMPKVPCATAFEYAAGLKKPQECSNLTRCLCPICRTEIKTFCWLAEIFGIWKVWKNESILLKNSIGQICINEANFDHGILPDITAKVYKILVSLCPVNLNVLRTCSADHINQISCQNMLKILMKQVVLGDCDAKVPRLLPCKHILSVKCSTMKNPPPICLAKPDNVFTYPCGVHQVAPSKCHELTDLLKQENPKCHKQVTCSRFRCGHSISIPCYLKKVAEEESPGDRLKINKDQQSIVESQITYCEDEREIKACTDLVSYRYNACGHIRNNVECKLAFSWAADNDKAVPCNKIDNFENPVCGHKGSAPCFEIDLIRNWKPWAKQEKPKINEFVSGLDENKESVIAYSMVEEKLKIEKIPRGVAQKSLNCSVQFIVDMKCGHAIVTKCSNAYWGTNLSCEDPVSIECPKADCKYVRTLSCNANAAEQRAGKVYVCKNLVQKICQRCNISKVPTECFQVVVHCNSEVSTKLLCGHEVTWTCGSEEDPRQNPLDCQPCIYPYWEKFIDSAASVEDNSKLMNKIYYETIKSFGNLAEVKNNVELPLPDLNEHIKSQKLIMKTYFEAAKSTKLKLDKPDGSLVDSKFYKKVFSQVDKKFELKGNIYFEPIDTVYGRGCELTSLNRAALNKCKPDSEGLIRILVGVAFKHRVLASGPPFCLNLNNKGKQQANKTSLQQKQAGYDCVQSSPEKVVFWETAAAVPLALVTLKNNEECKICLDYYLIDKGYSCKKKHFMCWECFENHVKQVSGPDSVGKSVDKDGNLLCIECDELITLLNVAKGSVPKNVFDLLEKLKSNSAMKKAVDKALQEQETRLKKEFERILAIQDQDEREAERFRLDIIENILTLRCPRCKVAFIDYEGCAALTCGCCKAGFCAFCLTDCGDDAHAHVPSCAQNESRQMFIAFPEFNRLQSKRRQNLIIEKIKNVAPKVQTLLLKKMTKDLNDLGITINSNQNDPRLPIPPRPPVPPRPNRVANLFQNLFN